MPDPISDPPLIGITTRNTRDPKYDYPIISSPRSYPQALVRAGATPVLLPVNLPLPTAISLLDRLDGVLFTGGGDIETSRFNGQAHDRIYGIDPERDHLELSLAQEIASRKLPFLGICRGLQVFNVALGGTLYTHLADQFPGGLEHACHPQHPTDYLAHAVEIRLNSRLETILETRQIMVNSLHHQGIQELAPILEPAAWAPDELIEAFELPGHPFGLAVQWHPEWIPAVPNSHALFSAFVQAAAEYQTQEMITR